MFGHWIRGLPLFVSFCRADFVASAKVPPRMQVYNSGGHQSCRVPRLVQLQALEGGPFHDFTNKAGLVVRDQSQQLFYKVNVGQHHLPIEPHQLHVIRDQIAPLLGRRSGRVDETRRRSKRETGRFPLFRFWVPDLHDYGPMDFSSCGCLLPLLQGG